jgi:hypothetical protein
MSRESDLYKELRDLRGRRATETPGLIGRLGPELLRLSRVSPSDDDAAVRGKVRTLLTGWMAGLPDEVRRAAEFAFALDPDGRQPQLNERTGVLCARASISYRTARRRMDEAIRLMAATGAAGRTGAGPARPDWEIRSLEALLRLDDGAPQLYEIRTIAAVREVSRIKFLIGLPGAVADRPRLEVDALFGVRVDEVSWQSDGENYQITVSLPAQLKPGDEHRFCLRYSVPADLLLSPHYAIVPLNPCARGVVRVRFDLDRPPRAVWRLDGVPYPQIRNRTPPPRLVDPDAVGDVLQTFTGLREGHGYGVAWIPTE